MGGGGKGGGEQEGGRGKMDVYQAGICSQRDRESRCRVEVNQDACSGDTLGFTVANHNTETTLTAQSGTSFWLCCFDSDPSGENRYNQHSSVWQRNTAVQVYSTTASRCQ